MTSIKDVAKHADVSVGTISRFFHEPEKLRPHTRERVRSAVEELGYLPNALARNFRLGTTKIILTLMEGVGDPFYGDVMAGITHVAKQRGYKIHVQDYERGTLSSNDLSDIVQSRQADGIIIIGGTAAFRRTENVNIPNNLTPIIICGETTDPVLEPYPRVQIDGFGASKELTNYLIGLGHRNIAFMGVDAKSAHLLDRENGYRAAMSEAGLPVHHDWIGYGQLIIAKSRQAIRELVNASTVPSAVICANDEMALGAISELRTMQIRVPDDISIVGFDNTRYAETTEPPLTTVAQPSQAIGETAMYRLLQAIKDPNPENSITYLPHRLIVRNSACPIQTS